MLAVLTARLTGPREISARRRVPEIPPATEGVRSGDRRVEACFGQVQVNLCLAYTYTTTV